VRVVPDKRAGVRDDRDVVLNMMARINAGMAKINDAVRADLARDGGPSQAYLTAFAEFDHTLAEMRSEFEANLAEAEAAGDVQRCAFWKARLVKVEEPERVIRDIKAMKRPPS
jgi:hypothetical protein